jgi:GntR family transcriptional regulator
MSLLPIVTEPVHLQLAHRCRAEIANGKYRSTERFPSERELAAEFGVSRSTANKVISNLIAQHVLVLRPGIGTFVAPVRGLHASLREMESFTDSARALGLVPETRVLSFAKLRGTAIPSTIRSALKLGARSAVIYFERLRLANGEPVILEYRWVRSDLVPGLRAGRLAGSFYHYLEEHHQIFMRGESHRIFASSLSPDEATKFQLPKGSVVLVVEGTGLAEHETPVWYQTLFYRGDRYELLNEVKALRSPGRLAVQWRNIDPSQKI